MQPTKNDSLIQLNSFSLQTQQQNFWQSLKLQPVFIKLFNWEYWPIWLANIPVVGFFIWFAIRARKIGFFTAVNPRIETGGLFGESKINILDQVPDRFLPKTIFVKKSMDFQWVKAQILEQQIGYPLIAKPNVGERGLLVAKIKNEAELSTYLKKHSVNFLIQEFIDLPIELAVMHHRFPNEKKGKVTSICVKGPLTVVGDGQSNIRMLMQQSERAILQLPRFEKQFLDLLNSTPNKGETVVLEPIGNHCRGTAFLNGNHLINEKLEAIFDEISNQMDGIYYGRFDMKCASPAAVENGEFKILEYNGVGAEPAHIYDAGIPVWQKYRSIYQHWRLIFDIYQVQKKQGVEGDSVAQLKAYWKNYRSYMAAIES